MESTSRLWTRRVLTGLVGFGMVASGILKFVRPPPLVENFERYHLLDKLPLIAVIELVCAALFLIPKTSSLGVLLVTGYFGGAVVAHLVANDPVGLVPVAVLGLSAWAVAWLRYPELFASFRR